MGCPTERALALLLSLQPPLLPLAPVPVHVQAWCLPGESDPPSCPPSTSSPLPITKSSAYVGLELSGLLLPCPSPKTASQGSMPGLLTPHPCCLGDLGSDLHMPLETSCPLDASGAPTSATPFTCALTPPATRIHWTHQVGAPLPSTPLLTSHALAAPTLVQALPSPALALPQPLLGPGSYF